MPMVLTHPDHSAAAGIPVIRRLGRDLLAGILLASSCGLAHACWEQVANWYGVNVHLLYAIAKTESNLNPLARNQNKNGSYDIGLMQINSAWLPTLKKYGIDESRLRDPCVNLQVGAWILSQNMQKMGPTWEAVGAYNARNPKLRIEYARRVYRNIPTEALVQAGR
ncbi:soluble lytic murein transglycosylase protein [Herbaspirillum rubrisubalbicans M1]|nr:soluble lytic murein transglycosylase protein [Herbaspirillum rubrisubalbicans M1]